MSAFRLSFRECLRLVRRILAFAATKIRHFPVRHTQAAAKSQTTRGSVCGQNAWQPLRSRIRRNAGVPPFPLSDECGYLPETTATHAARGSRVYGFKQPRELLIENNVVYRVRTCPLFQHYGKDNTIRNNIFAFGANGQLQRCREDIPCHHVAEGNLVYADVWTKRAKGAFGTALLCDPVAHTAIVKDAPSLQFGTGDFSIELWLCPTDLKIDSSDRRRHFLSKDGFPDSGWNLNVTVEGKPFIEMRDANKVTCANRPSGRIPENTWTHLVVVVDRANAQTRYYYNGVLDSAQDLPAGFTGALDARAATSPSA